MTTIGNSIATLGAPTGVAALLERAGDSALADTNLQRVARKSVVQVRSIDAIPALHAALDQPSPDPQVRAVVLDALISIGAADASIELLSQLRTGPRLSDGQCAELGAAMTSRGFPDESLKVFADALRGGVIADERVAELLRTLTTAPAATADKP